MKALWHKARPWRLGAAVAAGLLCMAAAGGDQDGDGVTDKDDDCPAVAGPAPTGCPRPDRDSDGLWDGVDSCPGEPEDPNGLQDGDGCPDDPDLVERGGVVQLRAPLLFDKKRTAPPRVAADTARVVQRWMRRDPRAQQVEVVVVVDVKEGRRDEPLLIAQDRASALATLLQASGLRSEQISTRVETPQAKESPAARTAQMRIILGTGPRPQATVGEDGGSSQPAAPGADDGGAGSAPAAETKVAATRDAGSGKPTAGTTKAGPADAGSAKGASQGGAGPGTADGGSGKAAKPASAGTPAGGAADAGSGKAGATAPKTGAGDAGAATATGTASKASPPAADAGPPRATADAGKPVGSALDAGVAGQGPMDGGMTPAAGDDWDAPAVKKDAPPPAQPAPARKKRR